MIDIPYNAVTYRPEQADIDKPRSQFKMNHSHKFSGKVGDLIPFLCQEVLPGDTFKVNTSKVVRFTSFTNPIMDNAWLDTYYFFVPNRLIWEHWTNFMGESEVAWMPQTTYTIPQINIPTGDADGNGFSPNSVADYLGVPPNICSDATAGALPLHVNALPFRAYAKICDDWFRAQQVCDPLVIYTGDNAVTGVSIGSDPLGRSCYLGGEPFVVCKNSDYFTACLPAPQSGPNVLIPTDGPIPVYPEFSGAPDWYSAGGKFVDRFNNRVTITHNSTQTNYNPRFMEYDKSQTAATNVSISSQGSSANMVDMAITNYAVNLEDAGMSIAKLRTAFQVQKFYEACARGGRRYIEQIKTHFGVNSPDARMQRSEYLGGSRVPIHISEVVCSDNGNIGKLGSTSRTMDTDAGFVKSFTEHGYLFGLCCVRYDHSYSNSLPKHFLKKTMWDFFFPVFSNISEQPVYATEIDATVSDATDNYLRFDDLTKFPVFGYNEAWADYRHAINHVSGLLRPTIVGGLGSWSFADNYAVPPILSDAWLAEDYSNVDDCLTVPESTAGFQFWADFYIDETATRCMPFHSIPGLVDHN